MGKSTTFIHASDLHLGAAFRGVRDLSPVWADRMLRSIPGAYRQMIDYALNEHVDFLIISGDVFDSSHPSYADLCLFCDGLTRLGEANIPVYYCMGNHDPYTMWIRDYGDLPDNVFVFDPNEANFFVFEKDGEPLVVLGGRSYYNQTWSTAQDVAEGISREAALHVNSDASFRVGVIHTGLDIDPTRSPVEPKELLKRHMDYWACGHIHHVHLVPEREPSIAFSGCIQGRDVHETGPHGVLKVTLRQNLPAEIVFLPTAQVVWEYVEVDITNCTTISDVQEAITTRQFERNADSQCQNMLCRIILTGATPLHSELSARVVEDLRLTINDRYPFFFIDAIVNDTHLAFDRDTLEKEGLFPAVYLATMRHQAEEKTSGLAYLEQRFAEQNLPIPHVERHFEKLCSQAETLVLDLLNETSTK